MHLQIECEIGYCSEVNQDRVKLDKILFTPTNALPHTKMY